MEDLEVAIIKAGVLSEALPYIRRFAGSVFVVKYGGNAIADSSDEATLESFARDVVLMASVGIKPVVVHGGGPQIGEMLARLAIESRFENGLRVTDATTLEVVQMVLMGKVNPEIVAAINRFAPLAVGLSGADTGLIIAEPAPGDLGFVGEVESINPEIVERLLGEGMIPVVATVGVDRRGQAYNINADVVAGAIAGAIRAEKLIYLTNVEGIYADYPDPASLIRRISSGGLSAMLASGSATAGMIPKLRSCLDALEAGVGSAHILDGRMEHSLLLEIFTDSGIGTMVVAGGQGGME
ncbi:MAG: acetylglutamate kinase [Actinomycetota bacterium]|nr:acetylglutamate kinase [Actinomycetota bacterium]